jgi:hypothetical protein
LYKEDKDEDEELKFYYGDEEIVHFGGKKVEEEDRDWVNIKHLEQAGVMSQFDPWRWQDTEAGRK